MIVYVLTQQKHYDGTNILSAWSSIELAKAAALALHLQNGGEPNTLQWEKVTISPRGPYTWADIDANQSYVIIGMEVDAV